MTTERPRLEWEDRGHSNVIRWECVAGPLRLSAERPRHPGLKEDWTCRILTADRSGLIDLFYRPHASTANDVQAELVRRGVEFGRFVLAALGGTPDAAAIRTAALREAAELVRSIDTGWNDVYGAIDAIDRLPSRIEALAAGGKDGGDG